MSSSRRLGSPIICATSVSSYSTLAARHPQTLAARLWITFRHIGLGHNAVLLDGGLRAWQAEQRPLETTAPVVARGSVQPRVRNDVLVDHAWVQQRITDGNAAILDARDEPFWTGAQHNTRRAARPGRVPGAINIPFRTLVDDNGRLLDRAQLQAAFTGAGVTPGQIVVTYCHVGQQASLLFVAAHVLGHDVRLYDGSFEDWSRRLELPVEAGGRFEELESGNP